MTDQLHDTDRRGFASDNYAGATPRSSPRSPRRTVATRPPTARTCTPCASSTSSRGTSATATGVPGVQRHRRERAALQSLLPRWGAVICSGDRAHPHRRERRPRADGRPQAADSRRPTANSRPSSSPAGLGLRRRAPRAAGRRVDHADHRARHVYTADEIRAMADQAHELGLRLHLDGARISNAAAALGGAAARVHHRRRRRRALFGGTKNGLLFGEAVVVLDPEAADGLIYLRKMDMQLASKMRFVSAQLIALLEGDLWLRSAAHANAMAPPARRLDAASPRATCGPRLQPGDPVERRVRRLPTGVADLLRGAASGSTTGSRDGRGPLDVLVRHDRGRHRRVRRRYPRGAARA